jgi:hypothetical protein
MAENTVEPTSLDEPLISLFYFKSGEPNATIFALTEAQAKLSGVFKSMLQNAPSDSTDEAHAVILNVVTPPVEHTDNAYYQINTNKLLSIVYEYLSIWKDRELESDYVTEGPVSTGDPSQFLKAEDVKLLDAFIAEFKSYTHDYDEFKYTNNVSYSRMVKIRTLAILLSQVDNYLDIESFAKKIYVYIATLVWNTSLVDIMEAKNDPEFLKLQQQASDSWSRNNPDKAMYVAGPTTGDGHENTDLDGVDGLDGIAELNELAGLEVIDGLDGLDDVLEESD